MAQQHKTSLRRTQIEVQLSAANESLKEVFFALYYRHEFARRNMQVYKAGKKIAQALKMPEERLKTFVQDGRFLTEDIRLWVEQATGTDKGARRKALRDYLVNFGVLPMVWNWDQEDSFLPRTYFEAVDEGANYYECLMAFKSLMGFEGYAMSVLEIGHPVIFPVVSLKFDAKNKKVRIEHLDLEAEKAPMFMDFSAPKTSFDHYMNLMLLDNEVCKRRPDILLEPEPEEQAADLVADTDEGEKMAKPKKEHKIKRVKPHVLDKHLEVLDVGRHWTSADNFYQRAKLYAARKLKRKMQKKEADHLLELLEDKNKRTLNKNEAVELGLAIDIKEWFSQRLKYAKRYEMAYQDIV